MVTLRFSSWRPAVLMLLLFAPIQSSLAAVDDFTDGNDDGWLHYNPVNTGNWSVANGVYRIQSGPPMAGVGPSRAGSLRQVETYSAFYMAADLVTWDNSLNEVFGLSARVTTPGLGTTKGYAFVYNTRGGTGSAGAVGLVRIAAESVSTLTGVDLPLSPNQVYRFVFFGAPGQLNGQVFAATNLTVPLASLSFSDSTFTSGTVGAFVYDNGSAGRTDVTFDNIEFDELRPTLAIEKDSGSTDVRLSWPDWATGYRLERAEELPAIMWDDLGSNFPQMGGRFITFEDTSAGQGFYRLTKP